MSDQSLFSVFLEQEEEIGGSRLEHVLIKSPNSLFVSFMGGFGGDSDRGGVVAAQFVLGDGVRGASPVVLVDVEPKSSRVLFEVLLGGRSHHQDL